MKRFVMHIAALLPLITCGAASANSLSFVYTGDAPQDQAGTVRPTVGQLLTFDVIFDFDEPTIGGAFDIEWDADVLAFAGIDTEEIGDPSFGRDPDFFAGNMLEGWAVGDFGGLSGVITFGTVEFEYLGGSTDLFMSQTSSGCDCWLGLNTQQPLEVEFGSIAIAPVPLPAAVWFLLSGVISLVGLTSRRSNQVR